MKTKKLNPTLGLWAVLAGSFFLISPMFAVVDVLPDFIGYALILFGVSKLADMNDKIEDAARLFRRLVILGLVRMGAIVFVYGMSSPTERPVLQLLCSFVLGVLDCMTLIPAWKKLSAGLLYLSSRHGGEALFDTAYGNKSSGSSKTLLEKITSATVVFLVAREVLATLPEFAVLTSEKGGVEAGESLAIYDFISLMRQMCALAALIWGIVWIARFVKFCIHVGKDRVFFAAMREKYSREVLTRPELFARRNVKRGMIFMCIGLCFAVDFSLTEIHTAPMCVTPDFVMGLLLLVGLLILRRYAHKTIFAATTVVTVAYTVLTAAEWVLLLSYVDLQNAHRTPEMYNRFLFAIGLRVVISVLSVVMIFLLVRMLSGIIDRYTGFSVTSHDSAQPNLRVMEIHKSLKRRLWVAFGFGVAAAASSVVAMVVLPAYAAYTFWEIWTLVDILIPVLYAVVFVHATMQIFEQIDYKYMLS